MFKLQVPTKRETQMKIRKKQNTLSLCMIVRDEEVNLADCLKSTIDVVDQIIIVDTGSTDRTVEIAKEFGAEVYHFKWCDDFAEARNESIKHATCDWILWMDADERLQESTSQNLRECLTTTVKPLCYKVTIRSLQGSGFYHDSDSYRLYSNHAGIQFEGRIHEQITLSARKAGAKEKNAGFQLIHYGYNLENDVMQCKIERNRILLRRIIEDNDPNQAYYYFTLGQNYSSTDDDEQALECYDKALSLKQLESNMEASLLNCTAQACFKLGIFDRVEKLSKRSLNIIPMQAGAVYNLFKLAEDQGNNTEIIYYLNQLLKNSQYLFNHPKQISTDTIPPVFRILSILGNAYLEKGDKTLAFQCYLEAWKESSNEDVLQKIIPLALELGELTMLRQILEKCIKDGDDSTAKLDLLAVIYIKQQDLKGALQVYEKLHIRDPENVHVIKRLIGLYAKTGQNDKVEELIKQLQ